MKYIKTKNAPNAIGPYSQGVINNKLIYTSGQIPINPKTNKLIEDDFKKEVIQVLDNINAILIAGGSNINNIIKLTVYITDLNYFSELNQIFNIYFKTNPPARSAVQVSALPLNARVEIEAIGVII